MVDVSPVPKTKSRTLSDVFGSAEVSSSGHRGVLRKAKHLRSFVDEQAPKSKPWQWFSARVLPSVRRWGGMA
jgi:hypothetical protein